MDLRKVKEALKRISYLGTGRTIACKSMITGEMFPSAITKTKWAEIADEALASIENPAENCGECERAFQYLEAMGVPRERAKTVSNGIDVLATRYRKEIAAINSNHAKQCAECIGKLPAFPHRGVMDLSDAVSFED